MHISLHVYEHIKQNKCDKMNDFKGVQHLYSVQLSGVISQ